MVYLTLFAAAFFSATLLPMGSEVLLLYDLSQEHWVLLLWSVATAGNTLGSVLNYLLGLKGEGYLEKKKVVSAKKMKQAKVLFGKYGGWTLLLSWVPFIGDPLTFIAGVFGYSFKRFVLIVALAKGSRYAIVIFFASSLSV